MPRPYSNSRSETTKLSSSDSSKVTERELQLALLSLVAKAEQAQSLTAMVTLVMAGLRSLGLKLLRMAVERRDERLHQQRQGPPCCPRCGCRLRRPKRKRTSRITLLGKLRYRRRSWQCARCHRTHAPLDAAMDQVVLHRAHSLEFVRELTLLCTLHAFERGCTLFERCFGFAVSTHLAHEMVTGIGGQLHEREMARAETLWKRRETHPEEFEPTPAALRKRERADRLYVMLDNSKVRIQEGKRGRGAKKRTRQNGFVERFNVHNAGPVLVSDGKGRKASKGDNDWRDVRALLIYREADVADCSKDRRKILHRRVLAHVGTQDQWRQLLHLAFHDEGVYVAREVVVVADGGAGIWDTIGELLPSTRARKVTQILDWCHAVSYLWKVAKKWKRGNRRKDVLARAQWVDVLVDYLAQGKLANVLQRLRRLQRGKKGELFHEIRRCLDYLEGHRGRMHYPQYRKAGMTIGSGAIESVHKWVIQARCKQAGMAWSEAGINAMMRLRCVWASGRWDEIFAPAPDGAGEKLNDSLRATAG
ncbi:MAG: hypothetical protein KKH99_14415 [Proteobacteria bacterium]|nr:hypothetical protein [Pseudomonadota bacterium]